ncbi:MAG: pyrroline-5-carboxylate reductase [Caulobacteraceae bacterium]
MTSIAPVMLIGAGRLGGALIDGWLKTGAVVAPDLIVLEPHPGDAAARAEAAGARVNPTEDQFARARTVVLAVKPQMWREAARAISPNLATGAVIVSMAAGVRLSDLSAAFVGRAVARAIPTTAVGVAKGAAAIFAPDPRALAAAHALLDPLAATTDLPEEDLMDAVVGVSGSAPGFVYAFIEALEAAGVAQGLSPEASSTLARATVAGATALMTETGAEPATLRKQVASPGGTTEAGLAVLNRPGGLPDLLLEAVDVAAKRARELGA